jgi:hypothetical protein
LSLRGQQDSVDAGDDHREAVVDVRPHGIGRETENPDWNASTLTGCSHPRDGRAHIGVIHRAG